MLEMQPNDLLAENAIGESGTLVKMNLRRHDSVDKHARQPRAAMPTRPTHRQHRHGWFPGYAIDLGTERLNMAFARLVAQRRQRKGHDLEPVPQPQQVTALDLRLQNGQGSLNAHPHARL